jgi:lysophospholipase L1-like esterase
MAHPNRGGSRFDRPMARRTGGGPGGLLKAFGRALAGLFKKRFPAQARMRASFDVPPPDPTLGEASSRWLDSPNTAEVARLNRRYTTGPRPAWSGSSGARGASRDRPGRALLPLGPHRKEVAAVMVTVLIACALSASLPGVWAARGVSNDPNLAAAELYSLDPTSSALPSETLPSVSPTPDEPPLAAPSSSAAPLPTPAPTRPPVKAPTPFAVYRFVALGDSLTSWPTSGPWCSRLDSLDAHLTLVNNAGIPGDTTAGMLARLDRDVWAYNPSVLFVMGGSNDIGLGVSTASTIANLKGIIKAANSKGVRVFLMQIPPEAWQSSSGAINSLNAAIVALGNANKVVVIDTHSPLSTSNGTYQAKYTTDGVHFTDAGAQVVANAVYARIKGLGF